MTPINERWPAIYQAWRAGEAPETIARRHGMNLRTVKERCSWVDTHFPPAGTVRMRALIGALAVRALEAASAGDLDAAERLGRIIASVNRILSQLETHAMKPDHPSPSRTGPSAKRTARSDARAQAAQPGSDEHKQLVAELEVRLDALARSIEQSAHSGRGADGQEGPG